jgi:uncharacterized membrane protein
MSRASEPTPYDQNSSSPAQERVIPLRPSPGDDVSEASDERRAARQLLGAMFVAAGIVHLTHRRFYRSLVPDWLAHARSDIEAATGAAQVFGGVVLFVPKLRSLGRWVNLAMLAPTVPIVIGELRHPYRLRPHARQWPGLSPVGPLGLAPGHVGMAAVLWWATRQEDRSRRSMALAPAAAKSPTAPRP